MPLVLRIARLPLDFEDLVHMSSNDPSYNLVTSVERVIRCLKGTMDHGSTYGNDSALREHTNADWTSDVLAMSYKFPSSAASNILKSFYDNLLLGQFHSQRLQARLESYLRRLPYLIPTTSSSAFHTPSNMKASE